MITLADLNPDQALEILLEDNVTIAVSASESRVAEVYRQGERPNTDLGDEFIEVLPNGVIRAMTKPMGVFRGNLAVTLYCKAQSNGTAKFNRIKSMLSQVESLVNAKSSGVFFFEINPSNVITPMTYNSATGYTTMTINVEWNTTE